MHMWICVGCTDLSICVSVFGVHTSMHMQICVVDAYIYVYVHLCVVHISVNFKICMGVAHIYTCVNLYGHAHIYVCAYLNVGVHRYMHMWICVHLRMCASVCTFFLLCKFCVFKSLVLIFASKFERRNLMNNRLKLGTYDIKHNGIIFPNKFLYFLIFIYGIIVFCNLNFIFLSGFLSLAWLHFMAYQPLLVIKCQILFIHTYQIYIICKHILMITFLNVPELIFFTQQSSLKYCCGGTPKPSKWWGGFHFLSPDCSAGQLFLWMTWLIHYLPTLCFLSRLLINH